MVIDIAVFIATLLTTTLVAAAALSGFSRLERRLGWASFAAHWASSAALLWLTRDYYGGGDILTYFYFGEVISDYLTHASASAWMRVLLLFLQRDVEFPFWMRGVGQSTGSMNAIAGVLLHLLGTKWAVSGAMASVSFSGKVALYRFLRHEFSPQFLSRVGVGVLLVPSVVFWTSGMVKESLAVFGVGWAMFGIGRARRAGWASLSGWLIAALGVLTVVLIKTYLLIPLVASTAVWVLWPRIRHWRGGALRWIVSAAGAYISVLLVGELFPQFSFENIGDEISTMQQTGEQAGGGSFVDTGVTGSTFLGQLAAAPAGLIAVLFRPLVFEVSNAAMLVNAAETTAISLLVARALVRGGVRGTWTALRSNGALLMAACFVLVGGIGIGLATTNLGTLSRYRVPLMPFYATAVLVLDGIGRAAAHRSRASGTSRAAGTSSEVGHFRVVMLNHPADCVAPVPADEERRDA